jgi:hypothetical protein
MIPASLKETLEPATLQRIEDALAPEVALRAKKDFEIEVEAAGEGTFTLALVSQKLTAKKGFAKKPLVSFQIGKGGWALLQRELSEALEGFPRAPELKRALDRMKSPKPGDLDAVLAAVEKLPDVCVRFDVRGKGTFAASRGPADEAGHELTVIIDGAALDGLLDGKPLSSMKADVKGDRAILPTVLAAFAPITKLLKS